MTVYFRVQILKTWLVTVRGLEHRVALAKDSQDVWVDNRRVETAGEFSEEGAEVRTTAETLSSFDSTLKSTQSMMTFLFFPDAFYRG